MQPIVTKCVCSPSWRQHHRLCDSKLVRRQKVRQMTAVLIRAALHLENSSICVSETEI